MPWFLEPWLASCHLIFVDGTPTPLFFHTLPRLCSDELMEVNAFAFVTLKLCSAWLAMRLDIIGLIVLTGTGEKIQHVTLLPSLLSFSVTTEPE